MAFEYTVPENTFADAAGCREMLTCAATTSGDMPLPDWLALMPEETVPR